MKKLLFVYNQHAGKGALASNLCEIINIFTRGGYEVTAYPTQAPLDGYKKIKEKASLFDLVVTAGGDGTLSEAVNGMMEQKEKIPLGYIPAGSTNDFASSMGISTKMVDAANSIINGVYYDYDVGEFNGEYYVYIAGFGAFTDVSYKTPQNAKNMFGHMAYVAEAIKRLPKYTGYDLKIEHDGEVIEGSFILGLVSNSISVAGMRKLISGGVCFDDGLFEVSLVKTPANPLALQSLLTDAALKKYDNEKHFITFKSSHIKFTSNEEIAWTLDGESGGIHKEVEIVNRKQAVRFVVMPDDKTAEQMIVNTFDALETSQVSFDDAGVEN